MLILSWLRELAILLCPNPNSPKYIDVPRRLVWMNSQIFLLGRVVSDWYY